MLPASIPSLFLHILGYDKKKDRIHIRLHELVGLELKHAVLSSFPFVQLKDVKMGMF